MQASPEPLSLLVAAVRRSLKAMVLRRAEPLGLTVLQFWTLVVALEAPGASQADLARRVRCDEPSVSRVVASLSRRGWLRTRRHVEDRRRILVELTATGRALARRLAPIAAEVRAEVEAPLDHVEREALRISLTRVATHLQQRLQDAAAEPTTPARARRRAGGDR